MRILAIESSCDETAAAIVENGTHIIHSVVASSHEMHEKYGGIVPEVAAREQLHSILPVLAETLSRIIPNSQIPSNNSSSIDQRSLVIGHSIDALAVSVGPGLIGSLLIGIETAKTLAYLTGLPIIPVNHVLAHMYANFVINANEEQNSLRVKSRSNMNPPLINNQSPITNHQITFPAISLVVSGGHTELYLMKSPKDLTWLGGTIDDAAGEAFDKTARIIGLGNGGGKAIEQSAINHKRPALLAGRSTMKDKLKLPRPMIGDQTLHFSFSGLKTAVMREWNKHASNDQRPMTNNQSLVASFAHEIQESITDVLVKKTLHAAKLHNAHSILISGGVAANTCLGNKFISTINDELLTMNFFVPPPSLCTDNAVYIASYAYFHGSPIDWHVIAPIPDLSVEK